MKSGFACPKRLGLGKVSPAMAPVGHVIVSTLHPTSPTFELTEGAIRYLASIWDSLKDDTRPNTISAAASSRAVNLPLPQANRAFSKHAEDAPAAIKQEKTKTRGRFLMMLSSGYAETTRSLSADAPGRREHRSAGREEDLIPTVRPRLYALSLTLKLCWLSLCVWPQCVAQADRNGADMRRQEPIPSDGVCSKSFAPAYKASRTCNPPLKREKQLEWRKRSRSYVVTAHNRPKLAGARNIDRHRLRRCLPHGQSKHWKQTSLPELSASILASSISAFRSLFLQHLLNCRASFPQSH